MSTFALIKNGVVENVVLWDGEDNIFDSYDAINIDGTTAGVGWTYDGKTFTAPTEPEPGYDELVQQAETQKQGLIDQANDYISSNQWPSKLALGRLSDADKVSFNLWLDYLDTLEAVDTSSASDINWPELPAV